VAYIRQSACITRLRAALLLRFEGALEAFVFLDWYFFFFFITLKPRVE